MSSELLKWAIQQGPVVTMLLLILGTGYKNVWGFRAQYDAEYTRMVVAKDAAYMAMLAEKDRAYAAMIIAKDAQLSEREQRIVFRDEQIKDRETEIDRERERADSKDAYVLRVLEAGKQAAEIAAAALTAKREAEIAAMQQRHDGRDR